MFEAKWLHPFSHKKRIAMKTWGWWKTVVEELLARAKTAQNRVQKSSVLLMTCLLLCGTYRSGHFVDDFQPHCLKSSNESSVCIPFQCCLDGDYCRQFCLFIKELASILAIVMLSCQRIRGLFKSRRISFLDQHFWRVINCQQNKREHKWNIMA